MALVKILNIFEIINNKAHINLNTAIPKTRKLKAEKWEKKSGNPAEKL